MTFLRNPTAIKTAIKNFEDNIQTVIGAALDSEVEFHRQKIEKELAGSIEIALAQYANVEYFDEDNSEVCSLPANQQADYRRRANLPVKVLIRALIYCRKHPHVTAGQLRELRKTTFKNFPSHLNIEVLPFLVAYGATYAGLNEIQKKLREDGDEETPEDLIPRIQKRPLTAAPDAGEMLPEP